MVVHHLESLLLDSRKNVPKPPEKGLIKIKQKSIYKWRLSK